MKLKITGFLALILISFLYTCSNSSKTKEPTDTPTSGDVNIVVDESFQSLFDTQIYTFHQLYVHAHVHAQYLPENKALQLLMNDSCKVAVMSRDLTKTERAVFESKNLFPISTKIAEDAIALIIHPDNPDSVLSVAQVRSILLGQDSTWKQINATSGLGNLNVVFDNEGSANERYMRDSLLKGQTYGKNVFAVKSNSEIIEYVSQHKNAVGFLSVNWISDHDDTTALNFLNKIKVVSIKKDDQSEAYKPYQAYIKTKDYAFSRDVYMISRQTRAGLGMGFVSFVAGEKGQLMILKAGLIPAIAPVRMVKIKTN